VIGEGMDNRTAYGEHTIIHVSDFWADHLLQNEDEEPDLILVGMH
jgi:hypothetical protein